MSKALDKFKENVLQLSALEGPSCKVIHEVRDSKEMHELALLASPLKEKFDLIEAQNKLYGELSDSEKKEAQLFSQQNPEKNYGYDLEYFQKKLGSRRHALTS